MRLKQVSIDEFWKNEYEIAGDHLLISKRQIEVAVL